MVKELILEVPVVVTTLPAEFVVTEMFPFGKLKLGWVKMLLSSARIWNFTFSQIENVLPREKFTLLSPGPFRLFLLELPNVPGVGWANAASLNHCFVPW